MEYYTGTDWKSIDAPPTITAFTVAGGSDVTSATIDPTTGGDVTIEIKGSLFDTTGAVVTFVGTGETLSTSTITRNSANLLTVTLPYSGFDSTNEPYTIKVTNGSGLSAELQSAIYADSAPAWDTASGSIATINDKYDTGTHATVSATDADGETVTYSLVSGSLGGLSLDASTGVISGDADDIASTTTLSFTLAATANSVATNRAFTITVNPYADGSSSARSIATGTTVGTVYTAAGYTGQQTLYLDDKSGNQIQTYTYKDSGSRHWFMICGIGDSNAGSPVYSSWYNNGSWSGTNTFGTLSSANLEYKNRLYFDRDYSHYLVMQGTSNGAISGDWYGNSSEVAYITSATDLSSSSSSLKNFCSGQGGPNLTTNGNSGETERGVTFLKGSASAGESRYGGGPQGEMGTPNVINWGPQNCESYRYAAVNALGCDQNGCNIEHYCWSADVSENYAARNFPGTNYGSPWNQNFSHLYWLFWGRSG
jgi:hypothetical protein